MRQIRWHGRGGQGAKTVSQLLAAAELSSGRSVQAFPEYGPERSGAPMRAYNRSDDRPIRRHCAVEHPDVVVVLDETLLGEVEVAAGLDDRGLLIVNTERDAGSLGRQIGHPGPLVCVPGGRLAAESGTRFANVVLLGGLAAALGGPPLKTLCDSARRVMGAKLAEPAIEATVAAIRAGYGNVRRSSPQRQVEMIP